MEYLSVTDIFKIGVGPSSSHTLGPWLAAREWASQNFIHQNICEIKVKLYGSLSLTGKGHATDKAIILGLTGLDPAQADTLLIESTLVKVELSKSIKLNSKVQVPFNPDLDIVFTSEFKDFHPNAMTFLMIYNSGEIKESTYYSLGGGFINQGEIIENQEFNRHPYPIHKAKDLEVLYYKNGLSMVDIVKANEATYHSTSFTRTYLLQIWAVMLECIYKGVHSEGILPGGLNVKRRASGLYKKLYPEKDYDSIQEWLKKLKDYPISHQNVFKWVSAFAIAVNEENAAMGRVVTAPTNGSAGVIPAVMMYYLTFYKPEAGDDDIVDFLSAASEIGCLFKKGATISAAMGGCQAEIGVSSAMAAAGLSYVCGGNTEQCLAAAEIAMEHHLGLTCDPIDGLVQIPCIERNSMGAIKAITAANIALDMEPGDAKIPLDKVIKTMWNTAQDMHRKYKETSEGGLATTVNEVEC